MTDSHVVPVESESVFSPYIHGTTSLIFSRLAKTEMQLISPVKMVKKYKVAPPGGEIRGGGLSAIKQKCMPCFGKLEVEAVEGKGPRYTLDTIIEKYAKINYKDHQQAEKVAHIEQNLRISTQIAFSHMNTLLIYLARANAEGITHLINKGIIENFMIEFEACAQVYYLILLLEKNIHINHQAIDTLSEEERNDLTDAIHSHLTFENILKKIIESKINIQHVYKNPTSESLEKVANLLVLPKTSVIKSGCLGMPKEVTLSLPQPFKVNAKLESPDFKVGHHIDVEEYMLRLTKNYEGFALNNLLENIAKKRVDAEDFAQLSKAFLVHVKKMQKRFDLIKDILAANPAEVQYSHSEKAFFKKPFPMVLISESATKIKLVDKYTFEYRATEALKFGEDIKLIATDSAKNRGKILHFFKKHDVKNIEVISFDELRKCKETKLPPASRRRSPRLNLF